MFYNAKLIPNAFESIVLNGIHVRMSEALIVDIPLIDCRKGV